MSPQVFGLYGDSLQINSFTKPGFYFDGWNTTADGSGDFYPDGSGYYPFYWSGGRWNPQGSLTLYAIWNDGPHTVTFDANGGTGSMGAQTSTKGESLNRNTFIRQDYIFTDWWNTAPDGSGVSYFDGGTYLFMADITLYAQWSQNHTVTFNANGGTGTMAPQVSHSYALLNPNSFTNGSMFFDYWSTNADGTGIRYYSGAGGFDYFDFTHDQTLYAIWSVGHTVTYLPNGGTGTMSSQRGAGFFTPLSNTFTNLGKVFLYWASNPDGSGEQLGLSNEFGSFDGGDLVLYAK